jgi:hypothetical protein
MASFPFTAVTLQYSTWRLDEDTANFVPQHQMSIVLHATAETKKCMAAARAQRWHKPSQAKPGAQAWLRFMGWVTGLANIHGFQAWIHLS